MKQWIRRFIGIEQLHLEVTWLRRDLAAFNNDITMLNSNISTLFNETDPRRKKASDRLTDQLEKKLWAEDQARKLSERGNA